MRGSSNDGLRGLVARSPAALIVVSLVIVLAGGFVIHRDKPAWPHSAETMHVFGWISVAAGVAGILLGLARSTAGRRWASRVRERGSDGGMT